MSPYIFVLVMEVLQMILQQFIDQDGQFLYHWRCTKLKLFQLSFADDLLLLCKADVASASLLCRGLDLFASLSGLHTNPQKSQLIISKAASRLRDSLLEKLGFQEGTYLSGMGGSPALLCRSGAAYQICFGFLGGLLGYGIYLPKGIIKEMIKRLRTFLWKGTSSSGYPKVAWEVVCRPIEEGGQGIKDIFALNRALMSKHLWAVIKQDRTSIWVDWIFQTYIVVTYPFSFGDGTSFSLWHDPWHTLGPLIIQFPRGPQMTNTGSLDKLSVVMEDGQWNWPMITDIACLEITHMLFPISEAMTESVGNLKMAPSTLRQLMTFSARRVPRLSGLHFCLVPSRSQRTALFFGLLSWGDCPHWINHGFTTQTVTAFCVQMESQRHTITFSLHAPIPADVLPLSDSRYHFFGPRHWQHGIQWASSRWRGKHVVNAAFRSLLASLVYHIWQECNSRRFQQRSWTPSIVGNLVLKSSDKGSLAFSYGSLLAH
ncbi:hypothetical protein Sango_3100800 [Sesamum angolense]|uniref:Reverse transcriptase domain-containing protein n=1 Tax=Sesamum angolense TaxID=2727404 RepID=A0AAE1T9A2_9LAMI|nr:hypothetical protein Sango_3100800 [Sesamum angolense]